MLEYRSKSRIAPQFCKRLALILDQQQVRDDAVGYQEALRGQMPGTVLAFCGQPVLGAALNNVDFTALTSKKYYYRSERYSSYYNSKYRYGADSSETMSLLRNFFRRIKSLGKKPHSGHSGERRSVRSRSGGSHSAGSHSRGSHTESK